MRFSARKGAAQHFASRVAEHLVKRYGYEEAKTRVAKRAADADSDERVMFDDIAAAIEDWRRRSLM